MTERKRKEMLKISEKELTIGKRERKERESSKKENKEKKNQKKWAIGAERNSWI